MIKGVRKNLEFSTLAWYVGKAGCKIELTLNFRAVPGKMYPVQIFCVKIIGPTGIIAYNEVSYSEPRQIEDSEYYGFRGALHNAVRHYNIQCKQLGIK